MPLYVSPKVSTLFLPIILPNKIPAINRAASTTANTIGDLSFIGIHMINIFIYIDMLADVLQRTPGLFFTVLLVVFTLGSMMTSVMSAGKANQAS